MKQPAYRSLWVVTLLAGAVTALAAPPPPASLRGDGPAPDPRPFSITRNDPGIDALIAPDAKVELVATGFGLNEGVTWVRDGKGSGFLLVAGLIDNVLYKIAPDNTVSVFMEKAGYTGNDAENVGTQTRSGRSHVLLIGPTCSGIDPQGRIVWCANDDRKLMRLEKDGTRTVLSEGGNGKRFSGPNDISIRSDGAIYLTDNDFGLRGAGKSPLKEMPNGIWRIKDGVTTHVLSDTELGGIPNGIAFSPDEKYLYLTAGNKMKRYAVKPDGTLSDATVFAEGVGIGDGMRPDSKGNIYSTGGAGPGTVRVTSPDGKFLGTINLPIPGGEPKKQICSTNVAFGDNDARTLFISACDHVYKIRLKVSGILQGPGN
jgi:gluconolactonase